MCDEYMQALVDNYEKEKMGNMKLNFDSRKFTEMEMDANDSIVAAARDLESEITLLLMPCRETSLALTKLEEAVMWAKKSINIAGVRGE